MRRALRILVFAHGWWAGPLLAVLFTVQLAVTGPAVATTSEQTVASGTPPGPDRARQTVASPPRWTPIEPVSSRITDTMARRVSFQLTARDRFGHIPEGGDADPALWCDALGPHDPAHIADMVAHTGDWRGGQLIDLAIGTTCPELADIAVAVRTVLVDITPASPAVEPWQVSL